MDGRALQGHVRYTQVKSIARGSFGFVLLALDRDTNTHVALKFIERGPQNITKYVEREILNHQRLRHPHIIRLKEVFLTDQHLVLVMEYASGGDLFKVVSQRKGLPEEEARWYFQQVMFAIDYAHRLGVANRDIKLENILLMGEGPRPLVKLADFGFSKDENSQSAPGSRVGTAAYLAPEVVANISGQPYDAKKADVWSCGVLLYALVTGTYPFMRVEDTQLAAPRQLHNLIQRILGVAYTFPTDRQLSLSCKDLIQRMLAREPAERLSVEQVLQHPWVTFGLQPAMLSFNDPLVAKALAEPPRPEVLEEVRAIVREAQKLPGAPSQPAAQHGVQQGSGHGSGNSSGTPPGTLESDFDLFDFHDA